MRYFQEGPIVMNTAVIRVECCVFRCKGLGHFLKCNGEKHEKKKTVTASGGWTRSSYQYDGDTSTDMYLQTASCPVMLAEEEKYIRRA